MGAAIKRRTAEHDFARYLVKVRHFNLLTLRELRHRKIFTAVTCGRLFRPIKYPGSWDDFKTGGTHMAKKTKRKVAHPKLPMERQLNLQHEGKYFDLRANFDRLNDRYFGGKLRNYKVVW